jgi:hypothetical protein
VKPINIVEKMTNEKWVKATVKLAVNTRAVEGHKLVNEEVPCIRKGCWAIHKGYNFTLTHVPSGLKLKDLRTQKAAKQLADELIDQRWNNETGVIPHFSVIEDSKPIIAKYAEHF